MSVESVMIEKIRGIFGLAKVTFDRPGESREQEGLFIDVSSSHSRVVDAREIAKVAGILHVFAPSSKLPFGYFSKRIAEASEALTHGFFFGPEENVGTFLNIAERKFDFTFLFDSQYDPAIGTITEIDLSYAET